MIKKETEIKNKISAKGILKAIDDAGLHIEDGKTGEVDTLNLDAFKPFLDKEISFSIAESSKVEQDIDE
ncbi:MAG TPA: hypothetical protein GX708_24625 [Gallicola sp.]|nr:hypothetical protein [Gallicola sp.]